MRQFTSVITLAAFNASYKVKYRLLLHLKDPTVLMYLRFFIQQLYPKQWCQQGGQAHFPSFGPAKKWIKTDSEVL
jgi:hypothetical protein